MMAECGQCHKLGGREQHRILSRGSAGWKPDTVPHWAKSQIPQSRLSRRLEWRVWVLVFPASGAPPSGTRGPVLQRPRPRWGVRPPRCVLLAFRNPVSLPVPLSAFGDGCDFIRLSCVLQNNLSRFRTATGSVGQGVAAFGSRRPVATASAEGSESLPLAHRSWWPGTRSRHRCVHCERRLRF